MNASLLPPRGIFVPTSMIFDTQLPSAVKVTWVQLRCLAWRGWSTPPLSIPELASLIGIHPSRLQRHLAQLEDNSALMYRSSADGKLIISFPEEPPARAESKSAAPDPLNQAIPYPHIQKSPETGSYFPARIMGYISYQEDQDPLEITDDLETLSVELEEIDTCF